MSGHFFITLYTDASFDQHTKQARMAWRGKCSSGPIGGTFTAAVVNIQEAEALAIYKAVMHALELYPTLEGFFINSDNLNCVHALWTFRDAKVHVHIEKHFTEMKERIGERWIRAKHVKAHTGRNDTRSYMNRSVDQMTRSRG